MKIPAKGFTHGGKFHADDVFATALLMIVRPDIKVTRGFVVPDGFAGIVYDVGCGMFYHHPEPRESRPNGVPYAAFGLLWRVLGAQLVGAHQARLLDENFVQPLDLNDNTGEQNSLADAIGSFNPVWDSGEDSDACFWRAVPFAKQVLENEIAAANAVNRADETVQNAYKNSRDGIVVLPDYMPWKNGLYKTDALFVVYPSQRGGYSAQCVTDYKTRRSKVPFPPAWGGQPEEILRLLTASGARMAGPGEFTIRAYLAGKLDLSQAEAVADIIASSSRAAHALAANQMRGGYSDALEGLCEKLLELTALLELELDFSEEEDCRLITVRNSGCSLKQEELINLFDSFYRGSNVGSTDGSGLGLYISRQLMQKMDGEVFAEIKEDDFCATVVVRKA